MSTPEVPNAPSFGPEIDDYQPNVEQSTCDPVAKPGVIDFDELLKSTYGRNDLGITRACNLGGQSEHKEGRALDYPFNAFDAGESAQAQALLNWLLATDEYGNPHAYLRRLGIMYVIWNRHIWSANRPQLGWRDYTGSDPHTNHIHFSFGWPGALKQTTWWTAAATHRNETQVIAVGLDDMLYHDLRHPDGSWSGYGAMGFGADEVAIAGTRNGETQVVAIGWDTVVYHNLRHADGSWTGFQAVLKDGANFNAKGVAIAGTPNGETQVVAIGQDHMLYHNLRHADGSWVGYNPMGFGADQVAIAGTRDGETQVVAVGLDETVYHNVRHGDGGWTGFAPLLRGGARFGAKRVAIAGTPNGESQVVAIGLDHMLYHNLRHADGNWEGYNPMGFGANEVTIAGTSNGEAQIVVSGLDDMVYHELRHTDGSWTTFQPVLRDGAAFGAKKVGIAGL